jgi:hypothetical protein
MMTVRRFAFILIPAGMVVLMLGGAPVRAATPAQAVLACRRIAAAELRLKCFDRAAARLAAALGAGRSAPAAAPVAAVAPALPQPAAKKLSAVQTFGMSSVALEAHEEAVGALPKPLSHITATVRRLGAEPDGRWIFTLSNGQSWVQVYANHDLLVNRGDKVTISRQLLGSYWLQLPDDSGCKVERLR